MQDVCDSKKISAPLHYSSETTHLGNVGKVEKIFFRMSRANCSQPSPYFGGWPRKGIYSLGSSWLVLAVLEKIPLSPYEQEDVVVLESTRAVRVWGNGGSISLERLVSKHTEQKLPQWHLEKSLCMVPGLDSWTFEELLGVVSSQTFRWVSCYILASRTFLALHRIIE